MKTFGTQLEDRSYQKRDGSYAIIVEEGKIAAIQFYQGCFLPGGGVDAGETFEEALRREMREELGWEVEDVTPLCEATQFYYTAFKDLYIENIGHFFTAKKVKGSADKLEEGHELVWLTPEEAQEKLYHEHQRWAVSYLLEHATH